MSKLLPLSDEVLQGSRVYGISDDFTDYNTGDAWTSLAADTTATVGVTADTVNGILKIYTDATDNNEAMVKSTNKMWKFTSGKPIYFRALVQYTAVASDADAVFVGLTQVAGANLIADTAGDIAGSNTCVGFYKKEVDTSWRAVWSGTAGTPTGVSLDATNSLDKVAHTSASSAYQNLEIEVDVTSSTSATARWLIDNVLVYQKTFTLSSPGAMNAAVYGKTGAAAALTVNVDRIDCYQLR